MAMAIALSAIGFSCYAQTDTIIVYVPSTQALDTILSVPFDTSLQSGHTGFFVGDLLGQFGLSNSLPTANLMMGVAHTDLQLASDWFDVADYPARAAIKLARMDADTLQHICSGMMVSRSMVLTAAHCIMNGSTNEFYDDGILAFPGYHNGEENMDVPSSSVESIYTFKRYIDGASHYDMALLQLLEPIGNQTGWIGIGFESDDFVESNMWHKFSYPGLPHPSPALDSARNFNGDSLYYDYGELEVLEPFIGIQSSDAFGRQGQSGSSFFYSDNLASYSLGVMVWSAAYSHSRITNSIYHQLKPIIENDEQVGVSENEALNVGVYPNPTTGMLSIELKDSESNVHVSVRNSIGQEVLSRQFSNGSQARIDVPGTPGLYLVEVTSQEGRAVRRIVKQ
jgi:hypothetical protein